MTAEQLQACIQLARDIRDEETARRLAINEINGILDHVAFAHRNVLIEVKALIGTDLEPFAVRLERALASLSAASPSTGQGTETVLPNALTPDHGEPCRELSAARQGAAGCGAARSTEA